MARLSNGIFGPVHGKIGTVVGGIWKQTSYLRSLPCKTNKPATPAQIACREKFKFVQEWLAPFYSYVTIGFKNHAKDKTEINSAFSANFRNAVTGVYPDLGIDYQKVILSKGNLPSLYAVQVQLTDVDTLKLTWQKKDFEKSSFDDQVMVVVYNRELKIADGFVGGSKRADLQCSLKLNPKLFGKSIDVYLCVFSLTGKKVSDSEYLGRLAPL